VTVAAVILAPDPATALADADGLPRVRREADAAWAGGASPVVVVTIDPEGSVSAALTGTSSILAEPSPAGVEGPDDATTGWIARGLEVARSAVVATAAALIWPVAMAWVDPETVTSLIEAHGIDREAVLRPAYGGQPGWPVLLPLPYLEAIRAIPANREPADLLADLEAGGAPCRLVELGDPGTVIDGSSPRSALPDYQGPPQPPSGHAHEWGAAVADAPEDAGAPPRHVAFEERG
jgi:CTP:molybdopterin cytidylyltransferase MocA